jgi:hypothetical protein
VDRFFGRLASTILRILYGKVIMKLLLKSVDDPRGIFQPPLIGHRCGGPINLKKISK